MIQSLADHVWQSSLFAVAAALLTLVFRKNDANIRFRLWLAASVKFLIPIPLVMRIGRALQWQRPPALDVSPGLSLMMDDIAQPGTVILGGSVTTAPAPLDAPHPWPVWTILGAIWALGAALLLGRWVRQWIRYRRIVQASAPLALDAPLPVRTTPARLEPGIFGIFRPVLLLPESVPERLGAAQMEAILAHELCHWRRRDNLTAAPHMLVEALFWFHPLVWWIGARLIAERERACDEAVIAAGHDPEAYAEGILRVCRMYLQASLDCVPGVSGGTLKQRIESIMTAEIPARLRGAKKILLAAAGGLSLLILASCVFSGGDAALDKYAGHYRVWNLVYDVTRDGDSLRIHASGQFDPALPSQVFPTGEDKTFSDSGHLAFITFVTDGEGNATKLTFRSANGGRQRHMRRIGEREAMNFPTYLAARIAANQPDPNSEAALSHYYEANSRAGEPDYTDAADNFANTLREDAEHRPSRTGEDPRGAFTSLSFAGVDRNGFDTYHVIFAKADMYVAAVMTPEGKIDGIWPGRADSKFMEKVTVDEKTLSGYVGKYQLHSQSIVTVFRENDRLYYQVTGSYPVYARLGVERPVEVVPDGAGSFHYRDNPGRCFFSTDASGQMSLHLFPGTRNGFEARRLTEEQAKSVEAGQAGRMADNRPLPGGEAALRRHIEERKSGQFSAVDLDPEVTGPLLDVSSSQRPVFAALGELQSLTFRGAGAGGWDRYDAHFDAGDLAFFIAVTPDGVLRGVYWTKRSLL